METWPCPKLHKLKIAVPPEEESHGIGSHQIRQQTERTVEDQERVIEVYSKAVLYYEEEGEGGGCSEDSEDNCAGECGREVGDGEGVVR